MRLTRNEAFYAHLETAMSPLAHFALGNTDQCYQMPESFGNSRLQSFKILRLDSVI